MRCIGCETFYLTRLVYQRCLALILLIAFLNAALEFKPLLGEHGSLPVPLFTKAVPFSASPSVFFLAPNDTAFTIAAWFGVLLACLALMGFADCYSTWLSMLVWAMLWVLYISFVNVGGFFPSVCPPPGARRWRIGWPPSAWVSWSRFSASSLFATCCPRRR